MSSCKKSVAAASESCVSEQLSPTWPKHTVAIYAVIAYTAYTLRTEYSVIQAMVESEFNANHFADIENEDLDYVVNFLMDIQADHIQTLSTVH